MQLLKYALLSAAQNITNPFITGIRSDKKFIFVCGCGHSGTTLLASRLGQHKNALLIGRESYCFVPPRGDFTSKHILNEWDYFATINNKDVICEKTPKHIHSIRRIKKLAPNSKIIIITRNPLDTIASLYNRSGNLGSSVHRWIYDNRQVLKWHKDNSVCVVKYEQLTADPKQVFDTICSFTRLDWDDNLLVAGESGYANVDTSDENMKLRVAQMAKDIYHTDGKWKATFGNNTARRIMVKTRKVARELGYCQNLIE